MIGTPKISLIGLPAAGKSTVSAHMRAELGEYDIRPAPRPIDAVHRELFVPGRDFRVKKIPLTSSQKS